MSGIAHCLPNIYNHYDLKTHGFVSDTKKSSKWLTLILLYEQGKTQYSLKFVGTADYLSPNKTWSYGFHKALYLFSTDIFSRVYTLKYFLTYWKPAFGIRSILNSAWIKKHTARRKKHTASPENSEKTACHPSGVAGFGVLRNLSLKIKTDGSDSTLLEFQCKLEALREGLFAHIGNPAGGRALLVMPPGAGFFPPATEQLCNSST